MSNFGKSLLNVNELLPLFEDSQGCCQWDDPVVLFALALDDQWPLVHLLDLHYFLARIWVVGSVLESELDMLLLSEGVHHCCSYVRHCRSTDLQQGSAPPQHQVC